MTLKDVLADYNNPNLFLALQAWAYGTERECPECDDGLVRDDYDGRIPCPTCHGTGKVREAGLVERVSQRIADEGLGGLPPYAVEALRAELGVPDDR